MFQPPAVKMIWCLVAALLGTAPACGQNSYYIRSEATGNKTGDDWNNAFTDLPISMVRGATYYVAGGAYTNAIYNLSTPALGTNWIRIWKASTNDHGTEVGWNDLYAKEIAR